MKRSACRAVLSLLSLMLACGTPATSATHYIHFDPNQSDLPNASGIFESSILGGYVSSFFVTIQGYIFNQPYDVLDNNAPNYNPISNVIGGDGITTAGLIGPFVDGVVLNLFRNGTYNLNFFNSNLAMGYDDRGNYLISDQPFVEDPSSVPVPATLPLFAFAVGASGLAGWLKRRRSINLQ
jgi:hypothetical protein